MRLRAADNDLGTATGFMVNEGGKNFLVTSRHVLRGRHQTSNAPLHPSGAVPDHVCIAHNGQQLGTWKWTVEALYSHESVPLWREHPVLGELVDLVALPCTDLDGVQIRPYDPWAPGAPLRYDISDAVNIVGFPFLTSDGKNIPVWTRGFVASDPGLDFNAVPCFLVDARTTAGAVGSPVIAYSTGGVVALDDGTMTRVEKPVGRFVGVYSGRMSADSDLGVVWNLDALRAILGERGLR
ncbi:MAG: trypsin-like peptidase domain-containing protein [Actinobacteria bacterium]|nr:trypsin-like peptidase domain-containing protein [Actinomycetota bacterium]